MLSLHGYDFATTAGLCTAVTLASDGRFRSPTAPRCGRRDRLEPRPGIGVAPDPPLSETAAISQRVFGAQLLYAATL